MSIGGALGCPLLPHSGSQLCVLAFGTAAGGCGLGHPRTSRREGRPAADWLAGQNKRNCPGIGSSGRIVETGWGSGGGSASGCSACSASSSHASIGRNRSPHSLSGRNLMSAAAVCNDRRSASSIGGSPRAFRRRSRSASSSGQSSRISSSARAR